MESSTGQFPKQVSQSLFQQDWWLNAVTEGNWEKQTVSTKFGDVSPVYGLRRRYGGIREIYSPPLSPYSGLYIDAQRPLSASDQYKLFDNAIPELLKKLPRYGRFKLNMSPEFNWWSPFYWAGFNQHTRYTYILDKISQHEACWEKFNSNIRRNIRKAEKHITVSQCTNTTTLYSLFSKTMDNQGNKPGYPASVIENVYREAVAQNVGTILTGYDEENKPHCSLFLVWDKEYAYYLSGGTDPELRSSGAMTLTMWQAIKLASEHVDTFNFEGSMQKGIDQFLRGFGAVATPYYSIGKGIFSGKIT